MFEWSRTAAGVLQLVKRCSGGGDLTLFLRYPLLPSRLDCSSVVVPQSGGPWEAGCSISRSLVLSCTCCIAMMTSKLHEGPNTKQYQKDLLSSQPGESSQMIPPEKCSDHRGKAIKAMSRSIKSVFQNFWSYKCTWFKHLEMVSKTCKDRSSNTKKPWQPVQGSQVPPCSLPLFVTLKSRRTFSYLQASRVSHADTNR